MAEPSDPNASIWKSAEIVQAWTAEAEEREQKRATHRQIMGELLPFGADDTFTFLDLGAGTGAATKVILSMFARSTAVLADFSPQMIAEGERALDAFAGRFHYVEFDLATGTWPDSIVSTPDAIITSLSVHHLPDHRKQSLFAEIFEHLAPGGWYLNYDLVSARDPLVEAAWQRVNDRLDPEAARKRLHRSPQEQARYENHVRYLIPLDQQLDYLRAAGFHAIDVYYKHLDNVIYGGHRPG